MIGSVSNFWRHHVVGSGKQADYSAGGDRGLSSDEVKVALAGAWTAATTIAGAALGAARGAGDVVTVEQIPHAETVRVPVGTQTVRGCYDYHYGYDFFNGEWGFHYGYNPSCVQEQTVYETQTTGRTLYERVEHHSQSFPRTALQGAALGLGLGVVTGVVGMILAEAIKGE